MIPFANILIEDETILWEILEPKIKRKIMSYNKDLMLVKVAFKQGGIGQTHQHPHLQMSYVASGSFEVQIGQENKILKEGDVFFIPSDIPHGVVCLSDGILIDVFNPMREDFVVNKI